MSVRSASRGSPAARSIRLALRTSSIVATSSASLTRCVLRCFGRRCLSSALRLAAISVMPFIVRFQDPPRADALNHIPIRYVNNVLSELMDGKEASSVRAEGCGRLKNAIPKGEALNDAIAGRATVGGAFPSVAARNYASAQQ